MQNVKGFEALVKMKNELEAQETQEFNEWKRERYNKRLCLYKSRGFSTCDELINYVLKLGNRIVNEEDNEDFIELEGDCVIHVFEAYDDCVGPLGRFKKYMSIDEFKSWVYKVLNPDNKYNDMKGFVPTWIKASDLLCNN